MDKLLNGSGWLRGKRQGRWWTKECKEIETSPTVSRGSDEWMVKETPNAQRPSKLTAPQQPEVICKFPSGKLQASKLN